MGMVNPQTIKRRIGHLEFPVTDYLRGRVSSQYNLRALLVVVFRNQDAISLV